MLACWRTFGGTGIVADATRAEPRRTPDGTTVAAVRLANCWLATCGGRLVARIAPAEITLVICVTLTLVTLTLRM